MSLGLPLRRPVLRRLIRGLAAGLGIAGFYLAVAGLSFHAGLLPVAPVLDGLGPPPPYRWVKPPPDLAQGNQAPSPGSGTIPLTSAGSAGSVTTGDGQAQLLLDSNSVPASPGQTSVKVTLVPEDPNSIGPPPSGGFQYDSNAYTIAAFYEPSNRPITSLSAVVVMTYATDADRILERSGSSWTSLNSTSAGSNQLFASITHLGTFSTAVLGGIATPTPSQQGSTALVIEVAVPFVLILVLIAVIIVLSRRRSQGGPQRG